MSLCHWFEEKNRYLHRDMWIVTYESLMYFLQISYKQKKQKEQ